MPLIQCPCGPAQALGLGDTEPNHSMGWSSQLWLYSGNIQQAPELPSSSSKLPRGSATIGESTPSHRKCLFGTMTSRDKPIYTRQSGGEQKKPSRVLRHRLLRHQAFIRFGVCSFGICTCSHCCLFKPQAVSSSELTRSSEADGCQLLFSCW